MMSDAQEAFCVIMSQSRQCRNVAMPHIFSYTRSLPYIYAPTRVG